MNTPAQRTCLVTGAGGYLGGRVAAKLRQEGWRVVELTRAPKPGTSAVRFRLGEDISPEALAGASALVHCAYDFKELSWPRIRATNVIGSEKLLCAARDAGIKNLVYISSISAYDGCRALYGKAKLETEGIALSLGAAVIRPGLIHGTPPGAMFGRLLNQVAHARVLPLFGGGAQIQYLVHAADLCAFIARCAAGEIPPSPTPVTVAHEQPWTFRQILEEIARAQGRRVRFASVPWRLVWAGIKCAELLRVPLNFRSDSLVSLVYQNPNPSFAAQRQLQIVCRPFRVEPVAA